MPPELLERALKLVELKGAAPTDRLELMATVTEVLESDRRDASAVRALAQATLLALADSLEGHPEGRSGLMRCFDRLNVS